MFLPRNCSSLSGIRKTRLYTINTNIPLLLYFSLWASDNSNSVNSLSLSHLRSTIALFSLCTTIHITITHGWCFFIKEFFNVTKHFSSGDIRCNDSRMITEICKPYPQFHSVFFAHSKSEEWTLIHLTQINANKHLFYDIFANSAFTSDISYRVYQIQKRLRYWHPFLIWKTLNCTNQCAEVITHQCSIKHWV